MTAIVSKPKIAKAYYQNMQRTKGPMSPPTPKTAWVKSIQNYISYVGVIRIVHTIMSIYKDEYEKLERNSHKPNQNESVVKQNKIANIPIDAEHAASIV